MLLANMAVAHKTHRTFPERALLRRHPPPQTKMLNDLVEFCEQMGLPMDFSSAGALNVSAGSAEEGGGPGERRPPSHRGPGHGPCSPPGPGRGKATLQSSMGRDPAARAGLGWAQKLSVGG